ncbi:MAG: 50S ribosomal protein L11 methyltransferase, partial [Selenomonadales bacterium]|nr:50S ribosomal protein L11 methyltransferase [Selenomonadales bacterium]
MSWAEISIQTTHEATEAVAEIFHEVGATGVVIEDPELVEEYRRSGVWDYCGIPEAEDNSVVTVKAYLIVNAELEDKMSRFKARVEELANYGIDKGKGIITWQEIKEEDWENSWKEYFHATKVGERIVIKPSWEEYDAQEGEVVLELDPGMAFGTGTHHTTAMCLRLLEGLVKPNQEIFDIGTGSGVLSIAA